MIEKAVDECIFYKMVDGEGVPCIVVQQLDCSVGSGKTNLRIERREIKNFDSTPRKTINEGEEIRFNGPIIPHNSRIRTVNQMDKLIVRLKSEFF